MHSKTYTSAKPFVKWVGGNATLGGYKAFLTIGFFTKEGLVYVEPFVEGGAVLFG